MAVRKHPNSNHGPAPKKGKQRDRSPNSIYREFDPSRPAKPSPLTASSIPDMPLDLVERIRSFPLFSSAPESFLTAIGSHLRPQLYWPQESVLAEGSEAKAMYFLVKGAVAVTSRDLESTYAELLPGSFFGEIGILMDIPRTASIVARQKSLVVRLNKEDLRAELPKYPEVEKAIREEAAERLAILEQKKAPLPSPPLERKRGADGEYWSGSTKRRKSPSPNIVDVAASSSALGSGTMHIRQLLTKFPLFASLPGEILHFIGLKAQPRTYLPFTDIITLGSHGREIYFICSGEVEVLNQQSKLIARLGAPQFFGEVTSLSLSPRRTATVRSVVSMECLVIRGEVLNELWNRCPPEIRVEVEETAKRRLSDRTVDASKGLDTGDTSLAMDGLVIDSGKKPSNPAKSVSPSTGSIAVQQGASGVEPLDPDPFGNVERSNRRWDRSRRGSLALNLPLDTSPLAEGASNKQQLTVPLPLRSPRSSHPPSAPSSPPPSGRRLRQRLPSRRGSHLSRGRFPERVLISIFRNLNLGQLMAYRRVSFYWSQLISSSPDVFSQCDLNLFNREVDDSALIHHISPFLGNRPRAVNLSNCYHITDDGFTALISTCGANVNVLKMKSVWDISPQAIAEMTDKMPLLEEIDLSNCRKVSDNLLGRIIGWTWVNGDAETNETVGCPKLSRLKLSYCKHISDRTMRVLAAQASDRLQQLDLTRCTTISDLGFHYWSEKQFPLLRKLVLADCTYLSDNAIYSLARAAGGLQELDLSFCCALSDASIEILCRFCRGLTSLDVAFCGSAVSDNSLCHIAHHMKELRYLSVRGCVRVTSSGVNALLNGCQKLEELDVSQCKNLQPWTEAGCPTPRDGVKVNTVASGKWRTSD